MDQARAFCLPKDLTLSELGQVGLHGINKILYVEGGFKVRSSWDFSSGRKGIALLITQAYGEAFERGRLDMKTLFR